MMSDVVKIVGLDPSSRKTGYAVLSGLEPGDLIDGGLIRPSLKSSAMPGLLAAAVADMKHYTELAAFRRTLSMIGDIRAVVEEHWPAVCVVEVPSGKAGTGSKRGARGSLTTYGMAAGFIAALCHPLGMHGTLPVSERTWTAGLGGERRRADLLVVLYQGRYDRATDPGCDVADAIGVARWALKRHGPIELIQLQLDAGSPVCDPATSSSGAK